MKIHDRLLINQSPGVGATFVGPTSVADVSGGLKNLTGLSIGNDAARPMTPYEYGATMIDGLSRTVCYVLWMLNRDMLESKDPARYTLHELTKDQIAAAKRYEADCPALPNQEK